MTVERVGFFVILAAALAFVYRLNDPPLRYGDSDAIMYVHDECYQAFTADRYVLGDHDAWNPHATRQRAARFATGDMNQWTTYEWIHPPTAKLIMAAFVAVFGFQPTAYRLGSVLFGVLALIMTWQLARRMRGSTFALLAVALLACDGLVFTMSRVAMNDIYVTGCLMAAIYFLYRYWEENQLRWLPACGAMFGVALSMKWSAGPLFLGSTVAVAGRIGYEAVRGQRRGAALARAVAAWAVSFLVAVPAIYMLSYVPYFWIGYTWDDFVMLNREIAAYHERLAATHSQSSVWWQWPLITRPVWFYMHPEPGGARVIYAMGNPFIWWLFYPSLAWVALRWVRQRQLRDSVILFGFCGVWLPWVFVHRVAFLQYLLPAVPFGVLAVATVFDDLARAWRRGRWLSYVYVAACLAVFVNFYPFWSAGLGTREDFDSRRWFWLERWRKT